MRFSKWKTHTFYFPLSTQEIQFPSHKWNRSAQAIHVAEMTIGFKLMERNIYNLNVWHGKLGLI